MLKKFAYWLLFGICCLGLGIFTGCAAIKETANGIAGLSTKALEEGRKNAVTKQFNYDLNNCYSKVKEALTIIGSYIYAQDPKKHSLAVYVSSEDTTEVGIFLKEIDAANTEIEISSPSAYAKEFIAKRLFLALEGVSAKKEMEYQ